MRVYTGKYTQDSWRPDPFRPLHQTDTHVNHKGMEYMKRTGQVIVLKRESYQLWKIAKGRRDFSCTVVSNTNEPAGRHKQHAISKDITDTKGLRLLMMLLGENGCVSILSLIHI